MSAIPSLTVVNRTWRGQPISVEIDPERTLIAEERPRQRGSEYGLRAGVAELNRWQLRRAKVGSRQLPGPTLFGKEMEKTRGHCYVERPEKDRFCFRR
jgi:hypothetical protein